MFLASPNITMSLHGQRFIFEEFGMVADGDLDLLATDAHVREEFRKYFLKNHGNIFRWHEIRQALSDRLAVVNRVAKD